MLGYFNPNFGLNNMDKPKCWVKNVIKKCTGEIESWVIILNVIFNICVCPYFTQFWVKTT